MTSDLLLRIFRASIPFMPKTAAKLGQELQAALQPLLLKPSNTAGSQVIIYPSFNWVSELILFAGASRSSRMYVCCRASYYARLHSLDWIVAIVQRYVYYFSAPLQYDWATYSVRLQQYIAKPTLDKLSPPEQRILFILLCIVSLLCEHCSFDRLRLDHPGTYATLLSGCYFH